MHDSRRSDETLRRFFAETAELYRRRPTALTATAERFTAAAAGLLKIRDKARQITPLDLNQTQWRIVEEAYRQRATGKPVRIVELKGRQQGSSTGIGGYFFLRAVTEPETSALIITEEKGASAKNIFQMYERFHSHFPVEIQTDESRRGNLLKFAPPLSSSIVVEGEKKVTSFTHHFIHLSEAAFFRNLGDVLDMLLQTVPMTPESAIVIETTANESGDDFHRFWQESEAGETGFQPLFIPSFVHEEYRTPVDDPERFANSLGTSEEANWGNEREMLETLDGVTLEYLKWRRAAIKDLCRGAIEVFNQQYPETPEIAFRSAGTPVFGPRSISWYRGQSIRAPLAVGRLVEVSGRVDFEDDPTGIVSIWNAPDPARSYIVGSDHAQGLDTGDYSAALVLCRRPRRLDATLRGYPGRQVGSMEFARQLWLLARYYFGAWVNPENNADGGTVCDYLSETRRYHRLITESTITGVDTPRFGWRNTTYWRSHGIALLQEAIRSRELQIFDERILNEAEDFIIKNGRGQARRKGKPRKGNEERGFFDDLIFAAIGALLAEEALPPPPIEHPQRQFHLIPPQVNSSPLIHQYV